MRTVLISAFFAASVLAGCVDSTAPADTAMATDPLYTALAGQSFSRGDFTITFNTNGRLTGENPSVVGRWEIKDGQFCRTITEPAQIAGSECQNVTIDGDSYTFSGSSGDRTYTLIR